MEDCQSIIGFLSRERETSMKHCPVKADLKTSSVAEELADISVEPVNREAVDAAMRELKPNQQAQADLVALLQ